MKTKKLIPLALCIAAGFGIVTARQKQQEIQAPVMPTDPNTKLVTYAAVDEVKNTGKNELFKRASGWFNTYYKNPTEVIREKDTVALKIVGKPRFRIYSPPNEKGVKMDAGIVQYTITVAVKEGKYKYEITEINWKQQSYYPIEKWIEQKDKYKSNNYYLYQTDSIITNDVIKNLQHAMRTAPKVIDKDNW